MGMVLTPSRTRIMFILPWKISKRFSRGHAAWVARRSNRRLESGRGASGAFTPKIRLGIRFALWMKRRFSRGRNEMHFCHDSTELAEVRRTQIIRINSIQVVLAFREVWSRAK